MQLKKAEREHGEIRSAAIGGRQTQTNRKTTRLQICRRDHSQVCFELRRVSVNSGYIRSTLAFSLNEILFYSLLYHDVPLLILCAGGLKVIYDLSLYSVFRKVKIS